MDENRKPKHEVDERGRPINSELRELEFSLSDLAAELRGLVYSSIAEGSSQLIEEYHKTMARMYELGWDYILDLDAHLAPEDMPKEYINRNWKIFDGVNWDEDYIQKNPDLFENTGNSE